MASLLLAFVYIIFLISLSSGLKSLSSAYDNGVQTTKVQDANKEAKEIKDQAIEDAKPKSVDAVDYSNMTKTERELEKIPQYEEIGYLSWDVPNNSGFKSFMDYRTITNTESKQYQLQQLYAETSEHGIRMASGRYCVAIGSHFQTEIGQYFDIILSNGTVIPCIMADLKADEHTDSSNIVTEHNGCLSEFIVDSDKLDSKVIEFGDMSFVDNTWDSSVKNIKVYNVNIFNMP